MSTLFSYICAIFQFHFMFKDKTFITTCLYFCMRVTHIVIYIFRFKKIHLKSEKVALCLFRNKNITLYDFIFMKSNLAFDSLCCPFFTKK